jgi:hypothetical protein
MSSTAPFIPFTQFDAARLIKTSPDGKKKTETDEKTGQVKEIPYFDIPAMYSYDAKDDKGNVVTVVSAFRVEGPKLKSTGGIILQEKFGRESASIFCTFDLTSTDARRLVECRDSCNPPFNFADPNEYKRLGFFEQLYLATLSRVYEERGQFGGNMATLRSLEAMEGAVKSPIYWPRDKKTSKLIVGKNPTKYFPLTCYGKKGTPFRKETVFTVPIIDPVTTKAKVLPWEMLTNVNMEFIPMFLIKKTYVGGGSASIQLEIESAIVTSIEMCESGGAQAQHAKDLANDEGLSKGLADQIAMLTRQMGAFNTVKTPVALPIGTDPNAQTTTEQTGTVQQTPQQQAPQYQQQTQGGQQYQGPTAPQVQYQQVAPQTATQYQAVAAPQAQYQTPAPQQQYQHPQSPAPTQATNLMATLNRGPAITAAPTPVTGAAINYTPVPLPTATTLHIPAVQPAGTLVIQ